MHSLIGAGSTGAVFHAQDSRVGAVAVKVFNTAKLLRKQLLAFIEETEKIQRLSRHPNVVAVLGILRGGWAHAGLVTQLARGGSLLDAMMGEDGGVWESLSCMSRLQALDGIVSATEAMHEVGILHGNWKLQNILFATSYSPTDKDVPRLLASDFGLRQTIDAVQTTPKKCDLIQRLGERVSSIAFAAPESVQTGMHSPSSDIFGLGIVIWAALTCKQPFPGVVESWQYKARVLDGKERPDTSDLPRDSPPGLAALLSRMWADDPDTRPSAPDVRRELAMILHSTTPEPAPQERPIDTAKDSSIGEAIWLVQRLSDPWTLRDRTTDVQMLARVLRDCSDVLRASIVGAGVLPSLLRLFSSSIGAEAESALAAMRNLACGNASIAEAIVEAGALPLLADLLTSTNPVEAEHAAGILYNIALENDVPRQAVVESGCLPGLVRVLTSGAGDVAEIAAGAIRNISCGGDSSRAAVVSAGAVPGLVQLLSSAKGEEAEQSVGALLNLSNGSSDVVQAVASADMVPRLTSLLSSRKGQETEFALGVLWNLSLASSDFFRAAVLSADVTARAAALLKSSKGVEAEWAAGLLSALGRDATTEPATTAVVVPPLVALLGSSNGREAELAASALAALSASDPEAYGKAVVDEGALPRLNTLLESVDADEVSNAALVIKAVALAGDEPRQAALGGGALERLAGLLDTCVAASAAAALAAFAGEAKEDVKNAIIEAGALPSLVELLQAQAGCDDAARVLNMLSLSSDGLATSVAEAGAIHGLIHLLEQGGTGAEHACKCIRNLIVNSDERKDMVLAEGGMAALVETMQSAHGEQAREAAAAIRSISVGSDTRKQAVVDAGAVPCLVDLLGSSNAIEVTHAAGSIMNVSSCSEEAARAVVSAGALPRLVALLSSDDESIIRLAAGAIFNISNWSDILRQAIVDTPECIPSLAAQARNVDWAAGALQNVTKMLTGLCS